MVSAGNYEQNRSITVVSTLRGWSVNPADRPLPSPLTMRSLGKIREQRRGGKDMAHVQQPNDLGAGLAAPEGHDVTANRFVQKSTLVLISLQARATVKNLVFSTIHIHARWARQLRSVDFRRQTERDLR
jgi:hypothetical protein